MSRGTWYKSKRVPHVTYFHAKPELYPDDDTVSKNN